MNVIRSAMLSKIFCTEMTETIARCKQFVNLKETNSYCPDNVQANYCLKFPAKAFYILKKKQSLMMSNDLNLRNVFLMY